jgi:hypothetical protein
VSNEVINLKDGVKPVVTPHWLLIESYADKRLVPLLRRLRDNGWKLDAISKEEYSSELMHEYASRVMSTLKSVSGALVGKSYIVLEYELSAFKEGDYETTRFVQIVLGLDENGKVWLRQVRHVSGSVTCENYGDVAVCLIDDVSIKNALGFIYDVPSDGVIKDVGRYRVQGDVIAGVDVINIRNITDWYRPSVISLIKWKCADRFYTALVNHGIDADLREAYQNPHEPVIQVRLMKRPNERHMNDYQILRRIEDEYFYELRDFINKELNNGNTWSYPINIEDARIDCHATSSDLNTRFYTVSMRINFNFEDYYYLWEKVDKLLLNHVLSDTGSYTYRLGRHEIEAYNVGNPITEFRFPQSWIEDIQYLQPLPPELTLKPSNYPRIVFVVNRDSKVVLKHPEHKEVVLTFDGLYMVMLMTERRTSTFTALMNEVVIDKLKQLSKQGGGGNE